MRKPALYKLSAIALTLITALAFCLPGTAAGDVLVNGEPMSVPLAEARAVGSGGVGLLGGEVWVMTADGLEQLGAAEAPEGEPGHLEVTDTLELDYDAVRVGLYYSEGLDYANLENEVGRGYELGYYDAQREFHALAYTDETEITMVPDLNVSTPGGEVGCFHVRMPGSYRSYDEALRSAGNFNGGFVGWYDGAYYALYGSYTSREAARAAAGSSGGEVFTASNRAVTVTRTSDAGILFEFDGGSSMSLAVLPDGDGGKAETWFKGSTYFGGFDYTRLGGGDKLCVVNIVDIEDYVKGVLPYEMSPGWPAEALKAQAVCARTYVASHFDGYRSSYGFDVTNDTYSQVYRGSSACESDTDAAVEATEGLYITYRGEPIDAMYCSSNGGGSEDSENVMYSAVAWLRGKSDPYEAAADDVNYYSSWTRTLSSDALASSASAAGYPLSDVASIETELSDSGNVIALRLRDSAGRAAVFERGECYSFVTGRLGLNSIRFEVSGGPGGWTFTGSGWGHSLGMSQYGAYAMADTYGFSFDQIINFYYTDVELARGV